MPSVAFHIICSQHFSFISTFHAYVMQHQEVRLHVEKTASAPPSPEPTRVQPKRERARTKPFMFSLMNVQDPIDHTDRVAAVYNLLAEAYDRESHIAVASGLAVLSLK